MTHILLVDWFALLNWSCLFVSTHDTKHCCQSKVSVFLLPVGTIPGLAWVSFSLVELVCSGLVMLVVVSYILVWVSYDLVFVSYDLFCVSYDLVWVSNDLVCVSYDIFCVLNDLSVFRMIWSVFRMI